MRSDLELNNLAIQLRKKWGEDERRVIRNSSHHLRFIFAAFGQCW